MQCILGGSRQHQAVSSVGWFDNKVDPGRPTRQEDKTRDQRCQCEQEDAHGRQHLGGLG